MASAHATGPRDRGKRAKSLKQMPQSPSSPQGAGRKALTECLEPKGNQPKSRQNLPRATPRRYPDPKAKVHSLNVALSSPNLA
jgi:hypothetical protein